MPAGSSATPLSNSFAAAQTDGATELLSVMNNNSIPLGLGGTREDPIDFSGDITSASASVFASADNSQALVLMPLHQQDKFMQLAKCDAAPANFKYVIAPSRLRAMAQKYTNNKSAVVIRVTLPKVLRNPKSKSKSKDKGKGKDRDTSENKNDERDELPTAKDTRPPKDKGIRAAVAARVLTTIPYTGAVLHAAIPNSLCRRCRLERSFTQQMPTTDAYGVSFQQFWLEGWRKYTKLLFISSDRRRDKPELDRCTKKLLNTVDRIMSRKPRRLITTMDPDTARR
ncbi:hypothetical protein CC86DRAFT_414086 [Ophiobolus disseminans]|uniref:Uncharacterized protein n=1 Tax=Ophiobolus disseminans TaxID=1469910 RepID=A0A6A6ZDH1_9PLEO|nr:hypothetical protein CC86DRAFT_414086 [Ophiobolus disseminans]